MAWLGRATLAVLILGMLGVGALRHPGCLVTGLNAVWLAYLFSAPLSLLILWLADRTGSDRLP